ncbi:MAG: PepSY domain-containing protein [Methanobacterium sp.]|jgi:cell division protein YceG involved in septum cleavage|uniref:PepSY domain-containing protein n=1 Tax=Methanobacterium subterraneum TaxID=59277 RepID=A0A2H4VSV4_9EURY|nr:MULTISPECIES: PepSY domain-containing protein [Methanobacterium]AUB58027.1 hypothetical protein BK008_06670 [Methanobacterium sp. MZ-A1]AUB61157.1 hypothetical protein BK009_11025 [Methanobacterium subterraneum]MBW4256651.1 PepSY domain-containing protein [Methanobacterium sp. YSL]MCC7560028.1 PepSY domain-containing protein [Methanobacterium sp.]
MNTRNILILIVVVLVILVGVVGYMLMQSFNNVTPNITNNTTQVTINKNQTNQTQSNFISASKAKSIASQYLNSNSKFQTLGAGTPVLKGSVYYVPMVVEIEGQHAKDTVLGNVKVDAKTGTVLGTEIWDITTGEPINEPP